MKFKPSLEQLMRARQHLPYPTESMYQGSKHYAITVPANPEVSPRDASKLDPRSLVPILHFNLEEALIYDIQAGPQKFYRWYYAGEVAM